MESFVAGGCIPHDREWAVMQGKDAHEWDPNNPKAVFVEKGFRGEHHGSKVGRRHGVACNGGEEEAPPVTQVKFHQLMTAEEMAQLEIEYNGETRRLTLKDHSSGRRQPLLDADLRTPGDIAEAEAFFTDLLGRAGRLKPSPDGRTPLRLVRGPEHAQAGTLPTTSNHPQPSPTSPTCAGGREGRCPVRQRGRDGQHALASRHQPRLCSRPV